MSCKLAMAEKQRMEIAKFFVVSYAALKGGELGNIWTEFEKFAEISFINLIIALEVLHNSVLEY